MSSACSAPTLSATTYTSFYFRQAGCLKPWKAGCQGQDQRFSAIMNSTREGKTIPQTLQALITLHASLSWNISTETEASRGNRLPLGDEGMGPTRRLEIPGTREESAYGGPVPFQEAW